MPTIPEVTVVIPTLNEEDNIGLILSDLLLQSKKIKEIIVVDGGSTDKTISVVKQYLPITILKSLPSPAIQRNIGWQQASTELIVFLDADTRCDTNFIEKSLLEFQSKQLDIACPLYVAVTDNRKIKLIYHFFNKLFKLGERLFPSGAGSCIVVKKSILQRTLGFSDKYRYEDIYFLRKASRVGKFRIIDTRIAVSPRRFTTYGIGSTLITYGVLSILFIFGAHRLANRIHYPFGKYSK